MPVKLEVHFWKGNCISAGAFLWSERVTKCAHFPEVLKILCSSFVLAIHAQKLWLKRLLVVAVE